jgi:hypothetical protein
VVLLDESGEGLQEAIEMVDPLNLLIVLALLVTADLVGVELGRTDDLVDVGDRGGSLE